MVFSLLFTFPISAFAATGTNYYVDSVNGNDNNNGTSTSTAWKTVTKINSKTFLAGDQILFKKGCTFSGALAPKGSGASGNHINLGAYGTGSLPIISAGTSVQYALLLNNQDYWTIDSLEITGGNLCGIAVRGNKTNYNYTGYTITNCVVHGCYSSTGDFTYRSTGLINFYLWDQAPGSQWNNVDIENCTVYDTTQFNGIGVWGSTKTANRSSNITIKNCVSHDTGGVGIQECIGSNVLVQNCLVYNAGTSATYACTGFELWRSNNATWQFNEAYNIKVTRSGQGNDNGCFDIDYYNNDVTVQYNYGHDAAGYGMAVLANQDGDGYYDSDKIANNITVRYNIFAYNDQWSNSAGFGNLFLSVGGNGSSFNGLNVYNNTFYHNPVGTPWAINASGTKFSGSNPNSFKNNIIYSTIPYMYGISGNIGVNNNLYYYTNGAAQFDVGSTHYNSLTAVRSSGYDANSKEGNPLLSNPTFHGTGLLGAATAFTPSNSSPAVNAGTNVGNMGSRDFKGNAIPQGVAYDMGAIETNGSGGGIGTGYYKIKNQYGGLYFDNYGSTLDGAPIYTYTSSGSYNQQWQFVSLGSGYYKIINRASGKVLDNSSLTTDNGAITQYADNGGGNSQQWSVVSLGGGSYKIISRYSGKAMDSNWATTNGVAVTQWGDTGSASQQWVLEAVQ